MKVFLKIKPIQKCCLVFLTAVLFVAVCATPARADDAFIKLGRGFTNVLTGIGELWVQPAAVAEDNNILTALSGGLLKGVIFMVGRELVGVYDLVTFPFPLPAEYEPVMRPGTLLDD